MIIKRSFSSESWPDLILALSICGILSGAEGWEEIEDFAKEHEDWFRKFLILPHGTPSHDTGVRISSGHGRKKPNY